MKKQVTEEEKKEAEESRAKKEEEKEQQRRKAEELARQAHAEKIKVPRNCTELETDFMNLKKST